jgi:hypothetical protein
MSGVCLRVLQMDSDAFSPNFDPGSMKYVAMFSQQVVDHQTPGDKFTPIEGTDLSVSRTQQAHSSGVNSWHKTSSQFEIHFPGIMTSHPYRHPSPNGQKS